jgi:enoyl reductase-like protein
MPQGVAERDAADAGKGGKIVGMRSDSEYKLSIHFETADEVRSWREFLSAVGVLYDDRETAPSRNYVIEEACKTVKFFLKDLEDYT